MISVCVFFFFNDTATTEIYTLSLHDRSSDLDLLTPLRHRLRVALDQHVAIAPDQNSWIEVQRETTSVFFREADRKSTRLNSSHANISYAVFCLKKKTTSLASSPASCHSSRSS